MNSFYEVLIAVQKYISDEYSSLLDSSANKELLKSYIEHYISKENLYVDGYSKEELTIRILNEMTAYSFLTEYLGRDDVEEININSWEDVKITFSSGEIKSIKETFQNTQHAIDIVRRMLRDSNMVWDNATPIQVGHLPGNIRITVIGFDIVDKDKALSVSIRKVNPKKLQKEDFVKSDTATDEMLEMLKQLYTHGVSMCFTGATGSGKTTLLSWILSGVPYDKRLVTIEQGTREFDCTVKDESEKTLNSVIHLSTRYSDNEKQNITQIKLLETIMTMNPDYIAVGESKGEEAMQTINAANTGHSVVTTTHANSCEDTYFRFISLCKLKYPNMNESLLQTLAVRAFPIVVYIKKLEDNSRKILKITEAVHGDNGNVEYVTLYRYVITEMENGIIKGHFEKVNNISEQLKERLIENGIKPTEILKLFNNNKVDFK